MTYRGQVKNGVVVLEGPTRLPEGTVVAVEPVETSKLRPEPGSAEAILNTDAHWHGDPNEAERLLEELRRGKWAEVEAELRRSGGSPPR